MMRNVTNVELSKTENNGAMTVMFLNTLISYLSIFGSIVHIDVLSFGLYRRYLSIEFYENII